MTNFSLHTSSSLIGGKARFAMDTHLDVNYSLFKSKGDSGLALEAAKVKQKVCKAEKHLANYLNVGRMHMECKKSGIAAFTCSDSGLMMIADNLLTYIFITNNPGHIKIFLFFALLV
ncbi:hypothetical protein EDD22DRAFT_844477 [Suillus occidentalis]|nr:hypothetical protein EDD22DRAFT_844477 [Suillus occidentalis]